MIGHGSSPSLISKRGRTGNNGGGTNIVLLGSRAPYVGPPPPRNDDDNDDGNDGHGGGSDDASANSSSTDTSAGTGDLVSLQSIDDDGMSERQHRHQQEARMREAEQTLVAAIGTSDPTSALLEYYQSLGKGKGKNKSEEKSSNSNDNSKPKQPTYRDIQHRDERGIITGWWRSVLRCPVMGREYPSGLPWSVWRHVLTGNDDAATDDAAADADWGIILAKLGETKPFHEGDGHVYFKSKKGARKAAATAAYEANLLAKSSESNGTARSDRTDENLVSRQVIFSSKDEAIGAISTSDTSGALPVADKEENEAAVQQVGASSVSTNSAVPAIGPPGPALIKRVGYAPRPHYPEWVNRLSRLGVTASSINIQLREHSPTQSERAGIKYLSRDYPTELCAVVEVTGPFRFKTSSLPSVSRGKALESMSLLVEEEAFRLNMRPLELENDVKWEIKEGLLRSAPDKTATFQFAPPRCFTVPIDESSQHLVAYETVFTNESGEEFIPSAMGLSPRACSRMALVLAEDFFDSCEECNNAFNTTVEIPTRNGKEKVNLALQRRTVISLGGSNDYLRIMRHFNTIVKDWKRYGFVGYSRSKGSVKLKGPLKFQYDNRTEHDRSCMFVPLRQDDGDNGDGVSVDWDLMKQVAEYKIEAYYSADGLVGGRICSQHIVLIIFGLFTTAIACQWPDMEERAGRPCHVRLACIRLFGIFFLSMSPPKKTVDDEALANRFLTQSVGMSGLFVLNTNAWLSGSTRNALTTFDVRCNGKERSQFTSCYEIYSKRYSTKLRYAAHLLIPAKLVKKHAKFDLLRSQESTSTSNLTEDASDSMHLPPELIHILPCPRDILYLFGQHSDTILLSLERIITLMNIDRRLQELDGNSSFVVTDTVDRASTLFSSRLFDNLDEGDEPLVLLDKATGLFPSPTYQRLEFLGDAILNHALAINLFAKNSDLRFDADELGDKISIEMNNKQLGKAALRVGIPNILGVGGSTSRECSQGTLSDVVEALIAVAFIRNPGGSCVVGLLSELELSFSLLKGGQAAKGFVALSPCFSAPYPFDLEKRWNEQIEAFWAALTMDRNVNEKLERGHELLCNVLDRKNTFHCQLSSPRIKLLLRCALFDDSLTGDTEGCTPNGDDKPLTSGSPLKGLNLVGIFRDNLFFIGNYALNLCISTEIYKRFPEASPKDLTLLTFCAFTDDTMAYIITKNDLTKCLFDKDAPSVAQFWLEMRLADKRGKEVWEENKGWLFGIDEYRRRTRSESSRDDDLHPRYPGLGGGLLVGHLKKVDKELTEDLAFSMKAICGALVLSFGVDGMWSIMGKLFAEVLILTPEENKQLYGENSVCQGWK